MESVITQTMRELEIILVDDGSTDETPAICDRYAAQDSRIRVTHKKNEGVSAARNTGIEMASGEYFLFFDADDYAAPEACAALYALAEREAADSVIYGYYRVENGVVRETCTPIFAPGNYESAEIVPMLLSRFIGFSCEGIHRWLHREPDGLYVENPALWRAMISGRLIRENGLTFEHGMKVGEDTIFLSLCLSYASRCCVTPDCYYYQVLHSASTIARYEKNPLAKLEGKERLLKARRALSGDILARRGMDIRPYWQGTVVMSYMELCFLFARRAQGRGVRERYRLFRRYAADPYVRQAAAAFAPCAGGGVRSLPFRMMKWRMDAPLFFCATLLALVNYEFQRG